MSQKKKFKNFYPDQYRKNNKYKINHNYLNYQFKDYKKIFKRIEKTIIRGDFTLGEEVEICEKKLAKKTGAKYVIGVNSGTDAIFLSLKSLNIGYGDEVITTPFTFVATLGAICTTGAKPVFVDVKEDYNINEDEIEKKITKKTKAIVPVHWSGRPCNLKKLKFLAKKYNLKIVQDSCHAFGAYYKNKHLVNFGEFSCYSMHPLKNLNVWGDGGFIATNNYKLANKLKIIRNHGLRDRDHTDEFSYNSRLDTIQAAVANYILENKMDNITKKRIQNSRYLDHLLKNVKELKITHRDSSIKEVFHLYQIRVKNRKKLIETLQLNSIDAKIHYPIPMHLQRASKSLGYKKGDFPVCENLSRTTLSLPVHEFLNKKDMKFMAKKIIEFYEK